MKIIELRAKSNEQLKELYDELAQKRRELQFKLASDQLKSIRDVRKSRKGMAKILTVMKERETERQNKKVTDSKEKSDK